MAEQLGDWVRTHTCGALRTDDLDKLISEETGLPVFIADDPLKAVANGTGVVLQEIDSMARVLSPSRR